MLLCAAYGDSFGAKRMRKPVQRRTVDYTSSVVRYVQVIWTFLWRFTMIQNLFSFSFRIFILYAFFFFVYIFALNLQCLSFGMHSFLSTSSADFPQCARTQARMWQRDARDIFILQPTPATVLDVLALTCNYVFKRWIGNCARNTDWSKLWKIVTML